MSELADSVKRGGTSMTIFGVAAIVLGFSCMLAPALTGLSIVMFVGVLVLIAGLLRVVWAFRAGSVGRGLWTFAIGGLTVVCGLVLVTDPIVASGILTILLAVYFFVDGIVEIVVGSQLRPRPGSGWLMFAGVLSVLLGIMIWSRFPLSGAWAIGVLLGIKLFLIGVIMLTGGSALRAAAKQ